MRPLPLVRKHPAVLLVPAGLLAVSAVASALVTAFRRKDPAAFWGAWGVSGVLLAAGALRVAAWLKRYEVVTNHRMLHVTAFLNVKVEQVPLSMLTDLAFRRSWAGRLLGYGTFIVTTPRGVKKIRFLPYPEQLYLEVCGLIFKDPGVEEE